MGQAKSEVSFNFLTDGQSLGVNSVFYTKFLAKLMKFAKSILGMISKSKNPNSQTYPKCPGRKACFDQIFHFSDLKFHGILKIENQFLDGQLKCSNPTSLTWLKAGHVCFKNSIFCLGNPETRGKSLKTKLKKTFSPKFLAFTSKTKPPNMPQLSAKYGI